MKLYTTLLLLFCLFIFGCAAPVKVVNSKRTPLNHYKNLVVLNLQSDVIGETNDDVMNKIMEKTASGILRLNRFTKVVLPKDLIVENKSKKSEVVKLNELKGDANPSAILKITLANFDKGNSFARFMFGALAGTGEVKLEMTVYDMKSTKQVLKAETVSKIQGSFASEHNVVVPLSKAIVDFVKDEFSFDETYQTINMPDGRKFYGIIRKITKDKLYWTDDNTLYIVKRKLIKSVYEEGKKLSWVQLTQRKYSRLNYNRYRKSVTVK